MKSNNPKASTIKKMSLVLSFVFVALLFNACSDDSGTDVEPERTLTKSQLYDKLWENSFGGKHEFTSDGTYRKHGTWRWLNGSDSMEIIAIPNATPITWHFYWSTDSEMKCGATPKEEEGAVYKVIP